MYKLEYLKTSIDDMGNIIYYISHKLNNKTAAFNLSNKFIEEGNKILMFPYANPEYKPVKKLKYNYRVAKVKNFLMFYTINEENKIITIVRVLYKKRNMEKIFE